MPSIPAPLRYADAIRNHYAKSRRLAERTPKLDNHPLAIEVAGAYLAKGVQTYADYLGEFDSNDQDAAEYGAVLHEMLPTGHERSISSTLLKSIRMLGAEGADFLRLASVLAVAPIPPQLIEAAFDEAGVEPPPFLFSGVANFGDWEAVIRGLTPYWMWRVGLIVLGVPSYYASMLLVGAKLQAFRGMDESSNRLREVCWTPYFTDGILAGLGGLLNPAGLFYVVASALPSTLGANAGLLSLPAMMRGRNRHGQEQVGPIERSTGWIIVAAILCLLFVGVLGRGLTWSR